MAKAFMKIRAKLVEYCYPGESPLDVKAKFFKDMDCTKPIKGRGCNWVVTAYGKYRLLFKSGTLNDYDPTEFTLPLDNDKFQHALMTMFTRRQWWSRSDAIMLDVEIQPL